VAARGALSAIGAGSRIVHIVSSSLKLAEGYKESGRAGTTFAADRLHARSPRPEAACDQLPNQVSPIATMGPACAGARAEELHLCLRAGLEPAASMHIHKAAYCMQVHPRPTHLAAVGAFPQQPPLRAPLALTGGPHPCPTRGALAHLSSAPRGHVPSEQLPGAG
jgi:hypothetical protein